MKRQFSSRQKLIYSLIALLVFTVGLIILGEITARALGYQPAHLSKKAITLEPKGTFFQPDSSLGYFTKPGSYTITFDSAFSFHCTNGVDGLRITDHNPAAYSPADIWVLGCSYTYGWGVNNEDTYLWKAQQALPQYHFTNMGTPGFGTLQNLLYLQQRLRQDSPPEKVILAYAGFHNDRNISTRLWRKNLASYNRLGELSHPTARLDDNNELVISQQYLSYDPLPFSEYLALMTLIENSYDQWERKRNQSYVVTLQLIAAIQKECIEHAIDFHLMKIVSDKESEEIFTYCDKEDISYFDITVDLRDKTLTNLPYDSHPNAKAHSIYADKLVQFLNKESN